MQKESVASGCFLTSWNPIGVVFSKGDLLVLKKQSFVDFSNCIRGALFLGQEVFLMPLQRKQTDIGFPSCPDLLKLSSLPVLHFLALQR